jgi:hypothetical protein
MMVEYAFGSITGKGKKVVYMNFLVNITPECDCVPWSDLPLVPDIGILASADPVAIDAACLDLINRQHGAINSLAGFTSQGNHQLDYGEAIGLGKKDYELIEI